MITDESAGRQRIAIHESAHSVAAFVLRRPVRGLSVVGGRRQAGVSRYVRPRIPNRDWQRLIADPPLTFTQWPATVRRSVETRALISAAGAVAEQLLFWADQTPARVPDPAHLALADAAPATAQDVARFTALLDEDGLVSDVEFLDGLSRAVYPTDLHARCAWLAWIDTEAAALVTRHAGQIKRLAAVAAEKGQLNGDAVRRILDEQGARA